MWVRTAMVLSVLLLASLIVVTPALLGRPTPGFVSLPVLIIGMSRNESSIVVYASWALQAYQYDVIRLTFNESSPAVNGSIEEMDSYGIHRWVPANASFTVGAYFLDHDGNYFQYNVTVRADKGLDNRTFMLFTFPYEQDNLNTVIRRYPPDDFRWGIPLRGTLP